MIEVSELTLEELYERLGRRAEANPLDIQIKGFVDAVCREEETGEVAWEVHQPNIFTDFGRYIWAYDTLANYTTGIFVSDFAETPRVDRCSNTLYRSGIGGSTCHRWQGTSTHSNDWGSSSKVFSYTFGTPSVNSPVATVGLAYKDATQYSYTFLNVLCYSLISPKKIQTTSQTLEISYRLTMNITA